MRKLLLIKLTNGNKCFRNLRLNIKENVCERTNNNDHGKTEAKAQHAKVEGRIIP